MRNRLLIFLSQQLPTRVRRKLNELKSPATATRTIVSQPPALLGISDDLPQGLAAKRALVMFRPDIWLTARSQYPNIKLYNQNGFIFSLVRALNECGFIVDLVDAQSDHQPDVKYDLFIGHGGHCMRFLDSQSQGVPVYQYISGLHWKAFVTESDERYERFFPRKGLTKPIIHRRSIAEHIKGQELLDRRTDVMFTIHCPRMVAAYGEYASKFHFTGLGAYLDELFIVPPEQKDFDVGRKNFIYVGGTGGNIQKGLDLLIEAFQQTPELNLYIYCKVEEEILKHCRKELASPNIHYIYYWKYLPFHKRLRKLLTQTNFSVHAPMNIGIGTAFMASMGSGLIPVGYVDLADPGECAVLTDSWQVDSLVECIRRASSMPTEWCRAASGLAREYYAKHCDPAQVERNFKEMFESVAQKGESTQ
jgi:glycosyltransferase involved in cell wall biosynthesis